MLPGPRDLRDTDAVALPAYMTESLRTQEHSCQAYPSGSGNRVEICDWNGIRMIYVDPGSYGVIAQIGYAILFSVLGSITGAFRYAVRLPRKIFLRARSAMGRKRQGPLDSKSTD